MTTIINPIFSDLPKELIQLIISYSDAIVFRYGIYLNRISKEDERYKMLNWIIQKPLHYTTNKFCIWFHFWYPELKHIKLDNLDECNRKRLQTIDLREQDKDKTFDGFVYEYIFNSSSYQNAMVVIKKYFHFTPVGYIYSPIKEQYIIDLNGLWRKIKIYTM